MNLKTKKIISSLLIAANLAMPANITLAKEESSHHKEVKVYFNDEQIEFDQQPIIVDGRTKVPFRAIFETMGTVVYYRESDKSIIGLSRDGDVIKHTVGTNKATINGVEKTYDSISEIRNYRTLIPVRMVADLLNAEVEWDGKNQEVEIEKDIVTNDYHRSIRKIIEHSIDQNFNPEDFKRYLDYQEKHPELDTKQVVIDVNMDLDKELVEYDTVKNIRGGHMDSKKEDVSIINNPHDPLVLVNRFNRLPDEYIPQNIIRNEFNYDINKEVNDAFIQLYNDALNDGLEIDLINAQEDSDNIDPGIMYRTNEAYGYRYYFEENFDEHKTGLLVQLVTSETDHDIFLKDIIDGNLTRYNMVGLVPMEETIDEYSYYKNITAEKNLKFEWLINNSYKYGFVLRYPKGKEHITRYVYMPWEFRYVGKEVAKIMHDENLCLEEYVAIYLNSSGYKTDIESTKKKVLSKY